MGKQLETKTGIELDTGDRVVFPRGVIKTVKHVSKLAVNGADSFDVTFADDSLTNYGADEVVKVMPGAPADAPGTPAPAKRQRRTAPAAPEQPVKRTRRSVEQVEKEALARGIQLGIERAAKIQALKGESDKMLSELEQAVTGQGMSLSGALARAFSFGIAYAERRIELDNS